MNSKANNNNVILRGSKITKFFEMGHNRVQVLNGIDIAIKKGEFIILFGSSGCGKSTLLNILLGLEFPSEGNVHFMDKDLYSYEEDDRSQIRKDGIGLIYQQQNWIRSLNVLENVAFPLTLKGVVKEDREKQATELLKLVGMETATHQAPTELSSGQQQRVSFARALISNPAIIVADEPTGNLDSKSSTDLMDLFKDYNEQGNTIIMVTHELEFLTYASRSLNISDGLIIAEYYKGDKELNKFRFYSKDVKTCEKKECEKANN